MTNFLKLPLAAAAVATSAFALPASATVAPTQLELSVGVHADDYGRFSTAQLAQIKAVQESGGESSQAGRIAAIQNAN